MTRISDDHDTPWKEALERYFPEFLALLFPDVHARINWARGHVFLDKELQKVVRDAHQGRQYTDKLIRVHTREGSETWVLIHVEIQGGDEAGFAGRMFVYHYRLLDRYGVDVVSLAVLADDRPGFRPTGYRRGRWGCEVMFRFPTVKLLDWQQRWSELERSSNIFALVVMAQIRAKASRNARDRKAWKFRLVRLLYDRGYDRAVILELFRVIDWMIRLPESLEREFLGELHAFEKEKAMPFIAPAEKLWKRQGFEKGHQEGEALGLVVSIVDILEMRFGPQDAGLLSRLRQLTADELRPLVRRALEIPAPDALFADSTGH